YNGDSNFNTSTSSTLTQTVNAAVNWSGSAAAAAADTIQTLELPIGAASAALVDGNVEYAANADPSQSTECACGCGCQDDSKTAAKDLIEVRYTSRSVAPQPIVLASLASDFCAAVPSSIDAQLTFNGTPQGTVTFATTGHAAGDVYALPLQVGS